MIKKGIELITLIIIIVLTTSFLSQNHDKKPKDYKKKPPFVKTKSTWVDSVYNSLSKDEKIAQLFMVAAYSNKDSNHVNNISGLINKYKIGGLIFFQGGPVRQAKLTNYYQSISKTPLMIATDAEWGLEMRLDSTIRYPRQMTLGAIQDNSLIYEMGEAIAHQCKRMNINVNFAPVIDVNSNPSNPVINSRSFGENKQNVAYKGLAYMMGLQDNNVLATAKHFPGHGDTDTDSHKTLPVVKKSYSRLKSVELFPFKILINKGLGSVMVAHLYIPALDNTKNLPSTLSKKIVTNILKNKLKFSGLIFTDALNMKGITKYYKPGDIEVKALLAGNDILLFPNDVPKAINKIKIAIENGILSWDEIDEKCKKIIAAKKWQGLDNYKPVELKNLYADLNNEKALYIKQKLVEKSLTLLKNDNNLIPFKKLDTLKMASVAVGCKSENSFQQQLNLYNSISNFNINKNADKSQFDSLADTLSNYNSVIVSIHNTDMRPSKKFGITQQTIDFINNLSSKTNVILTVFANPYCLSYFQNISNIRALLMSYEDNKLTQKMSAQLLFGGIPALGKLPVTASKQFKINSGIILKKQIRLKYSVPQELGIDKKKIQKIDSIILDAINQKAMPGCEVLFAKKGVVFYHKSFGYHTYEDSIPVKLNDIYDIASITKVASTTASLMKLKDEHKFEVNDKLSDYLCYLDTTDKKEIKIIDVLTHQARLKPWIPFYLNTMVNDSLKSNIYSKTYSKDYSVKVCDSLYILNTYRDSIYRSIVDSSLREENGYKYSDLGYYFLYQIIEQITKKPLQDYVSQTFYKPLGANKICYNPIGFFKRDEIVPTQNDTTFRKQLLHGYVHDPGAAMLGGVAGHAGLFTNANDLAKVAQMFLQKGKYAEEKYLKSRTVKYFTSCPYCNKGNRRGIGFDKPEMDFTKEGPTDHCVSSKSYGHTGFTGTMMWIDPQNQTIYIFLSNRINPNQDNHKLVEMNVRTNIQKAFYDALKN
ncbi:MAG: serine hydrolase [Bacteroidetes bacterium]|nr:MAG: serine hydrolase [Bacteroidota bacterium]